MNIKFVSTKIEIKSLLIYSRNIGTAIIPQAATHV